MITWSLILRDLGFVVRSVQTSHIYGYHYQWRNDEQISSLLQNDLDVFLAQHRNHRRLQHPKNTNRLRLQATEARKYYYMSSQGSYDYHKLQHFKSLTMPSAFSLRFFSRSMSAMIDSRIASLHAYKHHIQHTNLVWSGVSFFRYSLYEVPTWILAQQTSFKLPLTLPYTFLLQTEQQTLLSQSKSRGYPKNAYDLN